MKRLTLICLMFSYLYAQNILSEEIILDHLACGKAQKVTYETNQILVRLEDAILGKFGQELKPAVNKTITETLVFIEKSKNEVEYQVERFKKRINDELKSGDYLCVNTVMIDDKVALAKKKLINFISSGSSNEDAYKNLSEIRTQSKYQK